MKKFIQHLRSVHRWLRAKWYVFFTHHTVGLRNKVKLPSVHCVKKMHIEGHNNNVELLSGLIKCTIHIYGNDNRVFLGKNTKLGAVAHLDIGTPDCPCHGCCISIGDGTILGPGCDLRVMEDSTSISLGKECMFAGHISIWSTDSHSIFNQEGILVNNGSSVCIGDRVWCGFGAKIGKGVHVSSESVIGWGSVVTRRFETPGVVIAGNPAQVVRNQIFWTLERPNFYEKEKN